MSDPNSNTGRALFYRLVLIALFVVGSVSALVFLRHTLDREEPLPPLSQTVLPEASSYEFDATSVDQTSTGWLAAPPTPPDGGWEAPWGIDVFWITDRPTIEAQDWLISPERMTSDGTVSRDPVLLELLLDSFVEVYAPSYRSLSDAAERAVGEDKQEASSVEVSDVLYAFDVYAEDRNLGRGIILAGSGSGGEIALQLMAHIKSSHPDLVPRLGGVFVSRPPIEISNEMTDADKPTVSNEIKVFDFDTYSEGRNSEQAEDAIAFKAAILQQARAYSQWMDENLPKPAPPLPPLETIEIAPINKPSRSID